MKDGLLGFLIDFHQVLGEAFNGFGQWNIASVISANDSLALQVGNKDGRRNHGSKWGIGDRRIVFIVVRDDGAGK